MSFGLTHERCSPKGQGLLKVMRESKHYFSVACFHYGSSDLRFTIDMANLKFLQHHKHYNYNL